VLVGGAPVLALDGATDGARPVSSGALPGAGTGSAAVGASGSVGTNAAEATIAARTAKVSPKATSMRRQGSR
jgi:hypothetical protein